MKSPDAAEVVALPLPERVTASLSVEHWDIIVMALYARPFGEVAPVMDELQRQLEGQRPR